MPIGTAHRQLEGLRRAERVSDISSLHDPLRQEANPEPTERGTPYSEPPYQAGAPATAAVDGVSGGFAADVAAWAPGRVRAAPWR